MFLRDENVPSFRVGDPPVSHSPCVHKLVIFHFVPGPCKGICSFQPSNLEQWLPTELISATNILFDSVWGIIISDESVGLLL